MAKKKSKNLAVPANYGDLLESLKLRIRRSQVKATLSVNRELIRLYWDIGQEIVGRQKVDGWGRATVERLAADIQQEFPGIKGFSRTNIFRMRAFYLAYSAQEDVPQPMGQSDSAEIVPQPVGQTAGESPPEFTLNLPWGHNVVLIEKLKDHGQREWYAAQVVEHGWSRAVLTVQIESDLFRRQGSAVTNFAVSLPKPQSDLARQSLKDPYVFDFLTLQSDAVERDLELGLMDHVQKFLLELGAGFAFVGRQVPLSVGDDDFYLDLLFYHLKLRCFFIIDLKMEAFVPEHAGKMNFYLSAVDDQMKHEADAPSIGLILCKTQNRIVAEYALRDLSKPIGVAEWQTQIVDALPKSLEGSLPTIEQIESELEDLKGADSDE